MKLDKRHYLITIQMTFGSEEFKVPELIAAIEETYGQKKSDAAVRMMVMRLNKAGDLEDAGYGTYKLAEHLC